MPDDLIAEYLAKAEECRTEAATAAHQDEKVAWLRMAEDWLKLSRSVRFEAAEDERHNTRIDGHEHPIHDSKIVSR
ncbi:MAG TPA: hypothetical protein VH743_11835 [Beijerinckiaceae bacterium]|jgi:hypothetical protein